MIKGYKKFRAAAIGTLLLGVIVSAGCTLIKNGDEPAQPTPTGAIVLNEVTLAPKPTADVEATPTNTPVIVVPTQVPIITDVPKAEPTSTPTPTPEPTNEPTPIVSPVETPAVSPTPNAGATPTNTPVPSKSTPTPTPTKAEATPTNTPTPTPTPLISEELLETATEAVRSRIDTFLYAPSMVNPNVLIDEIAYIEFCVFDQIDTPLTPHILVSKENYMLFFYENGEISTFTKFPPNGEEEKPDIVVASGITLEEAYDLLCDFNHEELNLKKPVSEYDAVYDDELTRLDDTECYRFILTENNRNRGEFYISVDGTKIFIFDEEADDFIPLPIG